MAILLIVFSFVTIDDTSWIPISIVYAPKIYLLGDGDYISVGCNKTIYITRPDQKTVLLGLYRSHKYYITVSAHTSFSFSNLL
jgi:hypothetical protein